MTMKECKSKQTLNNSKLQKPKQECFQKYERFDLNLAMSQIEKQS